MRRLRQLPWGVIFLWLAVLFLFILVVYAELEMHK